MAYTSSTFALINPGAGKYDTRMFTYRTTDDLATITAADYFTSAVERGARMGDIVHIVRVDDFEAPTSGAIEAGMFTFDAFNVAGDGTVVEAAPLT